MKNQGVVVEKVLPSKYYFFYSGPFSQWYPSNFVDKLITFNRAEQYMMWRKALLFEDLKTADLILKSNNPKEQKLLGRSVKNYNEERWNGVCETIVYRGNLLKFTQNKSLLNKLLSIKATKFVEASPVDKKWGIGMYINDPNRFDESKWKGNNLLGNIITRVRDDILYLGLDKGIYDE